MSQEESQTSPVAIVTGGSRGIGKAIVSALCENGFHVVFSYNANHSAASELVESVQKAGQGSAEAVKANAASAEEALRLVEETHKKHGRVDVLVNNAGITKDGLVIRMKDDDWQNVLDTNLTGMFYTSRAAAKIMMKQRTGRIINISSVVGVYGNAGQVNYSASKAGIIGLTKSLAKELGSRNITVNCIAPGFIETDMTGEVNTEAMLKQIPLSRLGRPEDIAKAVAFLVTSGEYITGQVLHIDGGLAF
ncbi:MAG: 3-oxoacyl-[acyl-carrier-protein] reductase [Cyanobacteria bacterium P01_H01_bin.74]